MSQIVSVHTRGDLVDQPRDIGIRSVSQPSVAIQSFGQGRPLVLMHGWGFDSNIWHKLIPELLALSYQIYAVDLPGFGDSALVDWNEFKQQLFTRLPKQFVVAGWSLGGLYATRLAAEAPDRVLKLLNIATSPYFIQTPDWIGIQAKTLDDFYQQLAEDPLDVRRKFVQAQLPIGQEWDIKAEAAIHVAALQTGLSVLKTWDLRDTLRQLRMPVAYLLGRLDRIVPYKILDNLQVNYPHFHYTVLPRAGHMPFLSHGPAFLNWIQEVGG